MHINVPKDTVVIVQHAKPIIGKGKPTMEQIRASRMSDEELAKRVAKAQKNQAKKKR